MKKWPRQHLRLFAASVFLAVVFTASYFLVIGPLATKVADDSAFIETTRVSLHNSGWPLDPGRLAAALQMKKNELDGASGSKGGVRAGAANTLRHCTEPMNRRIKKLFDNPADFTRDVGRLDFQEEYNQVEQRLASRGVFLSDKMLKLGENSAAKDIYLLLLQVWMLDRVTALALESGLRMQTEGSILTQDESGRSRQAAKMQFQPVVEYRLYKDDQSPYVIELPLKIAFLGDSARLAAFLARLQSQGDFFAVDKIQISSIPELRRTETEFTLRTGLLSVEMECSAFFSPREISNSPAKPAPVKLIPQGA